MTTGTGSVADTGSVWRVHDFRLLWFAQAVSFLRDGGVRAHDGTFVRMDVETLCFHGDTPGAPAIVAAARAGLESAGVVVRPLRELIS